MTINKNISFEALKGLMGRANTQERLEIADEWLRENAVVTPSQYQECRKVWDAMYAQYGTWMVIITCGKVKHEIAHNLKYSDALAICEDEGWTYNYNNGCEWDMDIDQQWIADY